MQHNINRRRDDWEKVEADCRKALELDVNSVTAHYMLGLALLQHKQYADGVKQLGKQAAKFWNSKFVGSFVQNPNFFLDNFCEPKVFSGVSSLTNATLVGKESHGLSLLNAIFATGNAVLRNSAALDLPRRYLHSLQRNELLSNVRCLSRIWPKDFRVLFFNSQAPKKKSYEKFYPKDKKKGIPKEQEQKSESKATARRSSVV